MRLVFLVEESRENICIQKKTDQENAQSVPPWSSRERQGTTSGCAARPPPPPPLLTTAVAIGTLLLRPGFIHDQGPPRKLRTMQGLDGLLRLSRRTHIDKTKAPRLPGILIGNNAGGFNRTMG